MTHWMIAGASRGIGLGLTKALVRRGETVTASVRTEAARTQLAASGTLKGGAVLAFDLRDDATIRAAAAASDAPIDVLIANAGAYGPERQAPLDMDFDGTLDLFSINALGPLRVAQAFLPRLRRGRNPRIVFMSSVMGSMALEGSFNVAYRASKAALNKFMQGLAEDVKGDGVTVISLHPGWVRTDMGGADAPLSVEESVAGIIKTVDALTLAQTGTFLDYRGARVEW
jgi:NAD(P)-dependent dehydrogenase (short-subunit alcohol dehydrogenase family)